LLEKDFIRIHYNMTTMKDNHLYLIIRNMTWIKL
jgi:hypothetical protein